MATIITSRFHEKEMELFSYQASIVRTERNFEDHWWVSYNTCYRREARMNKDFNWSVTKLCLYKETFTAQARSLPRCFHCLQEDHVCNQTSAATVSMMGDAFIATTCRYSHKYLECWRPHENQESSNSPCIVHIHMTCSLVCDHAWTLPSSNGQSSLQQLTNTCTLLTVLSSHHNECLWQCGITHTHTHTHTHTEGNVFCETQVTVVTVLHYNNTLTSTVDGMTTNSWDTSNTHNISQWQVCSMLVKNL